MDRTEKRVIHTFLAVCALVMLWSYVSGDYRKLFRHPTPQDAATAQQRALDHLFGSDQPFDPSAENVTTVAESRQDNVSWKTLAHAKLRVGKTSTTSVAADFPEEVQKLDNHDITITGYMFPLQASGDQEHFLLSAYPPSCPYCLPGGATELIEVTDSAPLPFTYDPISIHGTLHLLQGDALKEGLLYRMTHIHLEP